MPSSANIDLPSPLAVACHDAGAANLIVAWLAGYAGQVRANMNGPACVQWEDAFPKVRTMPIEEALDGAALLLSGTGWASDVEHNARRLAAAKGIRNIAVLDHWVNYPERFTRGGEVVLPDELWVADTDAEAEARRCFPDLPVRRLPNLYMEKLVRDVATHNPSPANRNPRNILYVLEPIRQNWASTGEPGEFRALAYFLENLAVLGIAANVTIRLRPHPSDPPGKYDHWPRRYPILDLAVDARDALARQIAWADWVVGCETFALVIALHAGRIAVSSLPPEAPPCRLPHTDLMHLRDLIARST